MRILCSDKNQTFFRDKNDCHIDAPAQFPGNKYLIKSIYRVRIFLQPERFNPFLAGISTWNRMVTVVEFHSKAYEIQKKNASL